MGILKRIRDLRRHKKGWRKARVKLRKVAAGKIEERRQISEELRKDRHRRKQLKQRDPVSEERERKRKEKMATLHAEIMDAGRELDELDERIGDINGRRAKLLRKIKRASQRIVRLETKAAAQRKGPDRAIKRFRKDVGKTENPPGSNWGGIVTKMIQFTGYGGPVYWCGCAVCWWIVKFGKANIPTKIRLGYAGYIADDARHGRNGLRAVSGPGKGRIGTLWNYEHIVLCLAGDAGGMVPTGEGNTSAADGSQSNGGGVFPKSRPVGDFDVFAEVVDWG